MAQGDVFIDSDGKIGIDATGKIRLVDASSDCPDCCGGCTDSATSCTNCSAGITPAEFEVLFSGVDLCDSCEIPDGDGFARKLTWATTDVLNTKHTLTQLGTVGSTRCRWIKTLSSAVTIDEGITDCDFSTTTDDLVILLIHDSATGWTLETYVASSQSSALYMIFYDTLTLTSGDCELSAEVFENENTSADSDCGTVGAPADFVGGVDGTGTVSCA